MDRIKEIGNKVLEEIKSYDVDYAACSVSERESKEFNVEVDEFSLLRTLFDRSVSISIYKDNKHGVVALNSFDEERIKEAVRDAYLAAESSEPDPAWEIDQSGTVKSFMAGPLECDTDKLFMRTKELIEDVHEQFPKLTVESIISEHSLTKGVYLNTFGNSYDIQNGIYHFSMSYAGHEGEQSSHSYYSYAVMDNLDKPFIEHNMAKKELADTEKQAITYPLEEKFVGTVIFTPTCADDVVFGTIISNFVSDSSLIDGTSLWKDKLGKQVTDPRISMRFAPSDERIISGQKFTGEGYLTEDFDLIKDGVLQSFFLSQYGANKTGNKRSPNKSGALICKPGEKSIDEIISGVEKGIIVGNFSGGQPASNGEFSGVAKNAFLVENGKIVKALSETMISDNIIDMLFRLRDVSKEVREDGKSSIPYYAFDGITISGK